MILNTNYQGCMPSGSRQEDLLCVPYINLWKTCESGRATFGPKTIILTKLVEVY